MERPQIDPWKAIAFATDYNHIDDHYDRLEFLKACQEHDMLTIALEYPDFVAFCEKPAKEQALEALIAKHTIEHRSLINDGYMGEVYSTKIVVDHRAIAQEAYELGFSEGQNNTASE